MQSAPFLFVGEPGNFSLLSGGGQQAVQLSRRGRHRQKGVGEHGDNTRGGGGMELLTVLAGISSCVTGIGAALILLLRPVREALTGTKHLREGQKCLLRSNMLHTYYKNREHSAIRQYEYENFLLEYRAYKALRGNSFIDRIYQEVKTWDIVS